ncbi:Chemotaxis protein methyltransferase CheR [hydrothermal vent metagenome]|uniref:protein-glutamate O-methyltransferase n=1 Tax=hydrothermal vent metagenome TaxID=652676 RepID=A0A3B0Y141_9ZZZZ
MKDQQQEHEFKFTDRDFNFIRKLVGDKTGIVLADAKRQMVYGRLARRLRDLGLKDFKSYCDLIKTGDAEEVTKFTNAITTNLTSFFREAHHFEYLSKVLLPELVKRNQLSARIRIWSAGCSTGEEPYSIAMVVREFFSQYPNWDVKILATDLDTNVLSTAREGVYKLEKLNGISDKRKKKWLRRNTGDSSDKVKMSSQLQEIITFKQLNLLGDWPFSGPFDLIFCRNVVIYFNKDTQRVLVERYSEKMVSQGHLFLGHSESLFKVTDKFVLQGQSTYKKVV